MKLEKRCLILTLAVAAALFGGCGEKDDDDWERADRSHRYEQEESVQKSGAEAEPLAEPDPVEESKPLHNFNLARDAVFWYEYDANGELATVKTRGWFNEVFYDREQPPFIIADAEYTEDGNLVSLKATDGEHTVEVQYSTDGRIDSVVEQTKYSGPDQTKSLEVTYNDSTGFVYVVYEYTWGKYVKAELDSSLNITYCEEDWRFEPNRKVYSEFSDTDVVAKQIEYARNIKRFERTYYDNGQENERWFYDTSGELYHHIQYDRSGNILIDEDGNGKPYKY